MLLERISGDRGLLIDDRILDWVASRLPRVGLNHGWHGRGHGIGVVSGGHILAGVVFHDCDPYNIQISMAADDPRWATKATIRALLRYPFEQLNLLRITTIMPSTNKRAIRFNEGIGFRYEGRMRKSFGDDDAMVYGLLREETPAWMGFTKSPE